MTYEIVIVCNDPYAQHAATMLCSLFETNKDKLFHVTLLTDGLSDDNANKLNGFCNAHGSTLRIVKPEQDYCSIDLTKLPVGQWNTMMYYKLFIPQVLPLTADRCLFLDVDMVINDDISQLYHQDIGSYAIFAAEDTPDCIAHKQRLGLEKDDTYINSGVMLCNLIRWREMEKQRPIFDYVATIKHIITNEQDVIAMYFQGMIRLLPIRWNMTTFYFSRRPIIFSKYLPQLRDARRNPGIIHFASPIKPWFRDSQHPYRHLYRRYLKLTPWCYTPLQGYYEQLSGIKRIKKTIRNFLNRYNLMHDAGYPVI